MYGEVEKLQMGDNVCIISLLKTNGSTPTRVGPFFPFFPSLRYPIDPLGIRFTVNKHTKSFPEIIWGELVLSCFFNPMEHNGSGQAPDEKILKRDRRVVWFHVKRGKPLPYDGNLFSLYYSDGGDVFI